MESRYKESWVENSFSTEAQEEASDARADMWFNVDLALRSRPFRPDLILSYLYVSDI